MKGIVYTDFGNPENVLKIKDVERPVPADNEVLVKIKASSLNIADYKRFIEPVMGKEVSSATKHLDLNVLKAVKQILGMDFSGIVVEVGKNVTTVKKGDEVFGISVNMLGAWAEYACAKENEVYLKPSNLTFEESAVLPVACTVALGAIKLADVKKGQQVLVNGASGGVGLFTLQMLKAVGANVTAICSSRNVEMAYSFGADSVIDYTKENIVETGQTYDCILAINGYQTLDEYKSLLKSDGVYIPVGGSQQCMEAVQDGAESFKDSGKRLERMTFFTIGRDFALIKQFAEDKKITPVLDGTYKISEVSSAIKYIIKNHAQGKVALTIDF